MEILIFKNYVTQYRIHFWTFVLQVNKMFVLKVNGTLVLKVEGNWSSDFYEIPFWKKNALKVYISDVFIA